MRRTLLTLAAAVLCGAAAPAADAGVGAGVVGSIAFGVAVQGVEFVLVNADSTPHTYRIGPDTRSNVVVSTTFLTTSWTTDQDVYIDGNYAGTITVVVP